MKRILLLISVMMLTACAVSPPSEDDFLRAMWVTRWDYRTGEDVRRIVADAAELGVTDLIFQVRGQADAFYRSALEPWGEELRVEGAAGPGFDPLAIACEEAHRRRLRIHAWINVMPLWRGTQEPRDPDHLYRTRPEWRLHDEHGQPQPLNEHYVIVNPVLEPVHDYLSEVARDLVRRYPIDGLHLDYIRFVAESMDDTRLYPGDAISLAMFAQATGLNGRQDGEAYRAWIRDRITELVVRLRATVRAEKANLIFSAALWRDHVSGRERYLQDAPRWLAAGLLDMSMPMIYTDDDAILQLDLAAHLEMSADVPVLAGLGLFRHDSAAVTVRQLDGTRRQGAQGVALFAYHTMFDSPSHEQERTEAAADLRRERREAVRRWIAALEERP